MENTPTPLAGMPAQNSRAGMIVVSVGLLVAGLVAGYFVGKSGSNTVPSQTATPLPSTASSVLPTASISASATPTPKATTVSTATWKTYQNKEEGFEFRYPANWKITQETKTTPKLHIGFSTDFEYVGEFVAVNIYSSEREADAQYEFARNLWEPSKNVGGVATQEAQFPNDQSEHLIVQFTKGTNTYQFVGSEWYEPQSKDMIAIMRQMLSTFRFTK